ncbi:hypothetical protein [Candidatus Palauibacter sp.]|uniref:hypothetical protein n=1 Tax=Candidatus Palauibacter sp. TaxID=3101350 RepID=UPI003AF217CC
MERYEDIDVAPQPEVFLHDGTEQRQFGDPPPLVKRDDLMLRSVYPTRDLHGSMVMKFPVAR